MGTERSPVRPLAPRAQPGQSSLPQPEEAQRTYGSATEPTILLVGADTTFEPALRVALARHAVYVETATPDEAAETVVVTAPDLVLLTGTAAEDGGRAILEKLMMSTVTSVVPVAILDDNPALDARLRAFRHGAAAVIPRSASIDAIADQVSKLAREIPDRGGETLGVVGESTLSDLIDTLSKELRTGILSFYPGTDKTEDPVRLILGSGRPLAAFIDDFVHRVRRHVVHAEPLHYEFEEHAGRTLEIFNAEGSAPNAPGSIKGLRIALIDSDAMRADGVAQELRARGAAVVISDLAPNQARFERLRQADPEVLIISEKHVQGQGFELIRRMRRDTRLRWTALLVVSWEEIWSDSLKVPACDRLDAALASLSEPDKLLIERAEKPEPFDTRLETLGPARLLRTLTQCSVPLRMTVFNPRLRVVVDISDGLVVGAVAENPDDPATSWEGATALSALSVLSSGRVHIERVPQPAATNVMAPIDIALNMADSEPSPIAPSIPITRASGPAEGAARPSVNERKTSGAIAAQRKAPVTKIVTFADVEKSRRDAALGSAPRTSSSGGLTPTPMSPILAVSAAQAQPSRASPPAGTAAPASASLAPAASPTPAAAPALAAAPNPARATATPLPPHQSALAALTATLPLRPNVATPAPPAANPPAPIESPFAVNANALSASPTAAASEAPPTPPAMSDSASANATALQAASEHGAIFTPSFAPAPAPAAVSAAQPSPEVPSPSLPPQASASKTPLPAALTSLIPKASGDPGVSRSTTIVLVVLAASHGLLVAIGATSLWRKIDSFSAQSAAPVVTQKPVVKPTPPAPPAPIKEPEFESHDGANKPAPTCDALLADTRPQRGNMLGAAVEQGQIANKALVRGNLDEAQRAFCKAVRWDSSNVQRHLDLAQLLMLRRDGAATIEWSKKALALDPDNKRAFALLGDGYARTGDRDAAIQAWLKSLGLNDAGPKQIEVIAQRAVHEADTSFNRGDVARAERFYRRAILSQPDNAVAAAGLAQALLLIGEPGPAAKWAERAVSIGPGEARAHVALGDVLAQKGDMAGAKSQWDEANTLDPGNRDIAKRLKKAARQLE